MAAQGTTRTARRQNDQGRARRQPARPALPTHVVHFDGRDLTEPVAPTLTVRRREVARCSHCGTVRDARFAFCCEFAAIGDDGKSAPAARRRAPYTPPARLTAPVSAA
jgi:hypothetical protein